MELRAQVYKLGIYFPHSGTTSGNFPVKIKNSLFPDNIFHLMSKNLGITFSARRSCVPKIMANADLFESERKKNNKNKEITMGLCVSG